jgi:hypothetical protein
MRVIRQYLDHSATPVMSDVRYPVQGDPPKCAWAIWKRAILHECNDNQALHQSLGQWVRLPAYDPVSERLFHQSETTVEYQQVRTRRSRNSQPDGAHEADTCSSFLSRITEEAQWVV